MRLQLSEPAYPLHGPHPAIEIAAIQTKSAVADWEIG
jgi:hypothetical protein